MNELYKTLDRMLWTGYCFSVCKINKNEYIDGYMPSEQIEIHLEDPLFRKYVIRGNHVEDILYDIAYKYQEKQWWGLLEKPKQKLNEISKLTSQILNGKIISFYVPNSKIVVKYRTNNKWRQKNHASVFEFLKLI